MYQISTNFFLKDNHSLFVILQVMLASQLTNHLVLNKIFDLLGMLIATNFGSEKIF